MKNGIFFITIILSILFSIELIAGIQDKCGTASGTSAPYLPTSGNIKVLVIFAQFKDDPNTDNNGWARNSYPDWASTFVNSSTGGTYLWNNLSQYFNEMSNGTFQVISDVYSSLVITDNNESTYASIGAANREIIQKVDPYVNFANYDNLNGNAPGTDGIVDFVYIIYRNATWDYSAIALLEVSSTISVDGKSIVNNSWIGGGVQQRGGHYGRDYTLYIAAHELGHYLFGGANHIENASNLCLMSGGPVWNSGRGMHSCERQMLGWISYTDKSTDGSVTMSDYMTTGQVYRVPVTNSEYFLIENRQKSSSHDQAGDTGFYIYRITDATSFPPTIDVLCADGNWNFSIDPSSQTLTRTTPNVNSYDEMNYFQFNGPVKYACYQPVYNENSAWGDNEDAFDLSFNNVLSPASNPRSTNSGSTNFAIEVTGSNTIQFYFTNPYAGAPSKTQNLSFSGSTPGNPVHLTWDANSESDMNLYEVSRRVSMDDIPGSWSVIGTTTNSYYIDSQYLYANSSTFQLHYRIRAKDTQNKYSVYSDEVDHGGYPMGKISVANNNAASVEKEDYSELLMNYPNPFNPTTNISFSLPQRSNVKLVVYDVLGKEVATLANSGYEAGKYNIQFDGSSLSSGIYFYTLTTSQGTISKKMLLIK